MTVDNCVKQQTADSIVCTQTSGVPLLVAMNKIDLPSADINMVLDKLEGYKVLTKELGRDVTCSRISAKEDTDLKDFMNKILLQAMGLDLKVNQDLDA